MRKIYNEITLAWNEATQRYDKVLHEDSFMYDGEIAEAAAPPPGIYMVFYDAGCTECDNAMQPNNCLYTGEWVLGNGDIIEIHDNGSVEGPGAWGSGAGYTWEVNGSVEIDIAGYSSCNLASQDTGTLWDALYSDSVPYTINYDMMMTGTYSTFNSHIFWIQNDSLPEWIGMLDAHIPDPSNGHMALVNMWMYPADITPDDQNLWGQTWSMETEPIWYQTQVPAQNLVTSGYAAGWIAPEARDDGISDSNFVFGSPPGAMTPIAGGGGIWDDVLATAYNTAPYSFAAYIGWGTADYSPDPTGNLWPIPPDMSIGGTNNDKVLRMIMRPSQGSNTYGDLDLQGSGEATTIGQLSRTVGGYYENYNLDDSYDDDSGNPIVVHQGYVAYNKTEEEATLLGQTFLMTTRCMSPMFTQIMDYRAYAIESVTYLTIPEIDMIILGLDDANEIKEHIYATRECGAIDVDEYEILKYPASRWSNHLSTTMTVANPSTTKIAIGFNLYSGPSNHGGGAMEDPGLRNFFFDFVTLQKTIMNTWPQPEELGGSSETALTSGTEINLQAGSSFDVDDPGGIDYCAYNDTTGIWTETGACHKMTWFFTDCIAPDVLWPTGTVTDIVANDTVADSCAELLANWGITHAGQEVDWDPSFGYIAADLLYKRTPVLKFGVRLEDYSGLFDEDDVEIYHEGINHEPWMAMIKWYTNGSYINAFTTNFGTGEYIDGTGAGDDCCGSSSDGCSCIGTAYVEEDVTSIAFEAFIDDVDFPAYDNDPDSDGWLFWAGFGENQTTFWRLDSDWGDNSPEMQALIGNTVTVTTNNNNGTITITPPANLLENCWNYTTTLGFGSCEYIYRVIFEARDWIVPESGDPQHTIMSYVYFKISSDTNPFAEPGIVSAKYNYQDGWESTTYSTENVFSYNGLSGTYDAENYTLYFQDYESCPNGTLSNDGYCIDCTNQEADVKCLYYTNSDNTPNRVTVSDGGIMTDSGSDIFTDAGVPVVGVKVLDSLKETHDQGSDWFLNNDAESTYCPTSTATVRVIDDDLNDVTPSSLMLKTICPPVWWSESTWGGPMAVEETGASVTDYIYFYLKNTSANWNAFKNNVAIEWKGSTSDSGNFYMNSPTFGNLIQTGQETDQGNNRWGFSAEYKVPRQHGITGADTDTATIDITVCDKTQLPSGTTSNICTGATTEYVQKGRNGIVNGLDYGQEGYLAGSSCNTVYTNTLYCPAGCTSYEPIAADGTSYACNTETIELNLNGVTYTADEIDDGVGCIGDIGWMTYDGELTDSAGVIQPLTDVAVTCDQTDRTLGTSASPAIDEMSLLYDIKFTVTTENDSPGIFFGIDASLPDGVTIYTDDGTGAGGTAVSLSSDNGVVHGLYPYDNSDGACTWNSTSGFAHTYDCGPFAMQFTETIQENTTLDPITFHLFDNHTHETTFNIIVSLHDTNDPPICFVGGSNTAPGNTAGNRIQLYEDSGNNDITFGAYDNDQDPVYFLIKTLPGHGNIYHQGHGLITQADIDEVSQGYGYVIDDLEDDWTETITYKPDLNSFGTDSFDISVCDESPGGGDLCQQDSTGAEFNTTVYLNIIPVNDPPVIQVVTPATRR